MSDYTSSVRGSDVSSLRSNAHASSSDVGGFEAAMKCYNANSENVRSKTASTPDGRRLLAVKSWTKAPRYSGAVLSKTTRQRYGGYTATGSMRAFTGDKNSFGTTRAPATHSYRTIPTC